MKKDKNKSSSKEIKGKKEIENTVDSKGIKDSEDVLVSELIKEDIKLINEDLEFESGDINLNPESNDEESIVIEINSDEFDKIKEILDLFNRSVDEEGM